MRTSLATVLSIFVATLLSACALQPPAPKTLHVSEAKLVQMISSQFPFNSELLEVLDVDISAPRISLDPVANRINTSLDLNVGGSGLAGLLTTKKYHGGVDLSYGLRFEPSDRTVRLSDVKIHKLTVDGAPDNLQRPVQRLGATLAQKLLKDYVLYTVRPEDLQASQQWGYKPGAFRIEPTGLSITLDPIARP